MRLLNSIIDVYLLIVLIRVVLSWVNVGAPNQLVSIIYSVTEPVLEPIRRVVPNFGGMDLSPMILIMGIFFIRNILF